MAETLVIIWEKDQVILKLIESVGVWSADFSALKTIKISDTTRISRITNTAKQRDIAESISDLLENVDVDQPLWLLIPSHWVQKMIVESPDLPSTELRRKHLEWEASQKLHGDKSNYNIQFVELGESGTVEIRAIRADILESIKKIMDSIDLNLTGITVGPAAGETYSFETPHDLRESTPLESEDILSLKPHRSSIKPIIAGFIIVTVAVAGWYWAKSTSDNNITAEKLITQTISQEKPRKSSEQVTSPGNAAKEEASKPIETAAKDSETKPVVSKPEVRSKPPPQEVQPDVATPKSPLNILRESLPKGAIIEFAVISPLDMRLEISGQINANEWIKNLQKSTPFKNLSLRGKFTESSKKLTVIQLKKPGLVAGGGARNLRNWRNKAVSAGLSASGRSARGSANSAFSFVEMLWKDMHGFSKVYLAHDRGDWVVTVQ